MTFVKAVLCNFFAFPAFCCPNEGQVISARDLDKKEELPSAGRGKSRGEILQKQTKFTKLYMCELV